MTNSANKAHTMHFYPLCNNDGEYEMREYNLSTHAYAAKFARDRGIGFAPYVQAFGGFADGSPYRVPSSFAEVNFSVNNLLAFGATQLKVFCYRDYSKDSLTGMVTNGEPNERYYFVKDALAIVRKYDHVLLSFQWDHLYTNVGTGSMSAVNPAFEQARNIVKPITGLTSVKSKYDVTLNEFTDGEGNKAVMLFNYDDPIRDRKNKTTLLFENAKGALYYRNGEPTTVLLEDGKFEIELDSGEAVFVIPLYEK